MKEAEIVLEFASWGSSWVVGAPLMVLTVVVHVLGLGLIRSAFYKAFERRGRLFHKPVVHFAIVMSVTVSLVTILHVLQAALWASCFVMIGAIPTAHTAMLYSIGAMATYGHATVYLDAHWQMLGAMEALNGAILLGLSTAFLYAMIQQAWPGKK